MAEQVSTAGQGMAAHAYMCIPTKLKWGLQSSWSGVGLEYPLRQCDAVGPCCRREGPGRTGPWESIHPSILTQSRQLVHCVAWKASGWGSGYLRSGGHGDLLSVPCKVRTDLLIEILSPQDHVWHVCILSHFSHIWLFVSLWTVACQAPLSMGFSRQEYWNGLPCLPPGNLPDLGIEPMSYVSCIGKRVLYH